MGRDSQPVLINHNIKSFIKSKIAWECCRVSTPDAFFNFTPHTQIEYITGLTYIASVFLRKNISNSNMSLTAKIKMPGSVAVFPHQAFFSFKLLLTQKKNCISANLKINIMSSILINVPGVDFLHTK